MSMSYEADSGTYYSLNKDTNEYEYYSQVEPTDTTAQDPMVCVPYCNHLQVLS